MSERFPEGWDPITDGGYITGIPMDDGRYWCLMHLALGRLRIVIAEDPATAGEHWCYSNTVDAVLSYHRGPEHAPTGWSRHMKPDYTFEYPDDGAHYADVATREVILSQSDQEAIAELLLGEGRSDPTDR